MLSSTARFHFWDLAHGLEKRGMLEGVMTGHSRLHLHRLKVPHSKVKTFPHVHLFYRFVNKFGFSPRYFDKRVFDWLVSLNLPDCDVVMCMDGMGLRTGRAAQRAGAAFVLDRPCSHIAVQQRLLQEASAREGIFDPDVDPRLVITEMKEYEEADLITVPSKFALDSFVEQGVSAEKIRVIPYGVDVSKFRPVGEPDPEKFEVLYVGTLSLRKGTQNLFRAFERVNHPNKHLKVVGLEHWSAKAAVKEFGGRPNIEVCKPVAHEQLPELMSKANVFVLPSIEDGFGMVLAEAMACACPVIATHQTGGAGMLYEAGVHGLVVQAGCDDELAAALQQMADDPVKTRQMGLVAHERVQTIGGWDKYVDEVITMCEDAYELAKQRTRVN